MDEGQQKVYKRQYSKINDYKKFFSSDSGKAVLRDMVRNFMMQTSYSSADPLAMAYKEGQRSVVLTILNINKSDPEDLERMIEGMNHE